MDAQVVCHSPLENEGTGGLSGPMVRFHPGDLKKDIVVHFFQPGPKFSYVKFCDPLVLLNLVFGYLIKFILCADYLE